MIAVGTAAATSDLARHASDGSGRERSRLELGRRYCLARTEQ